MLIKFYLKKKVMATIKNLYDNNVNILQYFRDKQNTSENSSSAILTAYDMQAGTSVKLFAENRTFPCYHNGKKEDLPASELNKIKNDFIEQKFNEYIVHDNKQLTFLEAGTGEAVSLVALIKKLPPEINYLGFDISLSRIQVANKFCKQNNVAPQLFCADMLNIPLGDNSVDIIFTCHAIEPNTNKELEILSELYRVCSQYLILIEPSYELGNEETRKNIEKHHNMKNLKQAVNQIDCEILFHDLLPASHYRNMAEMYILKKKNTAPAANTSYVCPQCKQKLILHNSHYFCQNCLTVYPVLNNIPDLNINHSILFSQYLDG